MKFEDRFQRDILDHLVAAGLAEMNADIDAMLESTPTKNKEEEKFKASFKIGITLLGSLVLDIKRIADAMEKQS